MYLVFDAEQMYFDTCKRIPIDYIRVIFLYDLQASIYTRSSQVHFTNNLMLANLLPCRKAFVLSYKIDVINKYRIKFYICINPFQGNI